MQRVAKMNNIYILHFSLPTNKSELHSLMKSGKAIEFHARFTSNAHKIPGLSDWFQRPEGTGSATISAELP